MRNLKDIFEGLLGTTGADIDPDDYMPIIGRFPKRGTPYKMPNEDTGPWPIVIEHTNWEETFDKLVEDLQNKETLKEFKIKKLKQESIYKLKPGKVYITLIKSQTRAKQWLRVIFSYCHGMNDIIPLAKQVLLTEHGNLSIKVGQMYDPSGYNYQRFECPMDLWEKIMKKLNITNWRF